MEMTCSRCHQTVRAEDLYCPVCGLPQLVYSADASGIATQPEQGYQPVRDASTVDWKSALKTSLVLAIPAGAFCSLFSPLGDLGLLLMAAASAWTVALYMRNRKPAWITIGAGTRIGLVIGLIGAWAALATTGVSLFGRRFWFHQGATYDNYWQSLVQQMSVQWTSMGVDAQTIAFARGSMLSTDGKAGWILGAVAFLAAIVLLFSMAGGALGARFWGRPRRTQV